MRVAVPLLLATALVWAVGCGDDDVPGRGGGRGEDAGVGAGGDGGGRPPTPREGLAQVRGVVYAPGNGPGQVEAGHEIPVFDALVQLTPDRVTAIPQMVYCARCEDATGLSDRTSHRGVFQISDVTPGTYWLTVQKGQFRIERQVTLTEDQVLEAGPELTTLPSAHNPSAGDWIPRIALALGSSDYLEDVFGKMGVGTTDDRGAFLEQSPASDAIDFYGNGSTRVDGPFSGPDAISTVGPLAELMQDRARMMQYHIIFVPCSTSSGAGLLRSPEVLNNIREYVAAGGRLYVTDWSGEWHDNVFPEFVELRGAGVDTPASAYDATSNTWNTAQFGDADGTNYDSQHAEAVDDDLRAWLDGQEGPVVSAGGVGGVEVFNASDFYVEGNWNVIESLERVQVGSDEEGLPLYDEPKAYVIGDQGGTTPKKPLTVTYEPAGCGRVLFSTYHTTDTTHPGLAPQERILLYLIMEIGVCKEGPIIF